MAVWLLYCTNIGCMSASNSYIGAVGCNFKVIGEFRSITNVMHRFVRVISANIDRAK